MRTRIKICGLTRAEDVQSAVRAGADALGFVFYPLSPRAVTAEHAKALCFEIPPFVTSVGLFVNEEPEKVQDVLDRVPLSLLQFHGDESDAYCASFGRPFIKAARVSDGFDLLDYARRYPSASGLLVDAWVDGYGGGGQTFDWSLIPDQFDRPIVLAGGLTPQNIGQAISSVKPWAVDVSSGVESAKGVKSNALMCAFVAGVHNADGQR